MKNKSKQIKYEVTLNYGTNISLPTEIRTQNLQISLPHYVTIAKAEEQTLLPSI